MTGRCEGDGKAKCLNWKSRGKFEEVSLMQSFSFAMVDSMLFIMT